MIRLKTDRQRLKVSCKRALPQEIRCKQSLSDRRRQNGQLDVQIQYREDHRESSWILVAIFYLLIPPMLITYPIQ